MYLWIKTLHVVSIISWMAGLLYLPRLFVYHANAEVKSLQSETFKVMERRLSYAIMTPAMVVSWISGLIIAFQSGYYADNWFKIKFILVILMTIFNFYLLKLQYKFNIDANIHSNRFYRLINEIPTVLMLLIVGLVILKP